METCYLVSVSTLKEILHSQATESARYRVVTGEEMATVIHYGPAGLLHQVAFPVAYRIPEVPEDEGTLILMVATERSREWDSFWVPIEKHLVQSSTNAVA
ncbi:MAG TPA: hypothetical protein VLT16_01615 [Candidatus Limnocylindrales bacterium]|nr:hypothetical protein [Candidatus Limnocylindrales bacterium]